MLTCGYCRIEGHKGKAFETTREEEKTERINYRKYQQMKIKTVWQEIAKFTTESKIALMKTQVRVTTRQQI